MKKRGNHPKTGFPDRMIPLVPAALLTIALFFSLFYNGVNGPYQFYACTGLCAALIIIAAHHGFKHFQAPHGASLAFLGLFFGFFVYTAISLQWSSFFYGSYIHFWTLLSLCFSFIISDYLCRNDTKAPFYMLSAILLVAGFLCLLAGKQFMAVGLGSDGLRASFINPNSLAGFLNLALLPLIALSLTCENKKWFAAHGLLAAVLFIVLLLTKSHGALYSFAGAALVLLALLFPITKRRPLRIAVLAGGFLLLTAGMETFKSGGDSYIAPKTGAASSTEARLSTWDITLEMVLDKPFLGRGLATYRYYFPAYRGDRDIGNAGIFAHMDPLQLWAELGITVPVIFYVLLAIGGYLSLRTWKRLQNEADKALFAGSLCAILAVIAHTHITFHLYIMPLLIGLGILLGIWFFLVRKTESEKAKTLSLPLRRSVSIMLLFILFINALHGSSQSASQVFVLEKVKTAGLRGDHDKALRYLEFLRLWSLGTNPNAYMFAARTNIAALENAALTPAHRDSIAKQTRGLLDKTIAVHPRSVHARYDIGRLAMITGNQKEAEDAYSSALELNAGFLPARARLAALYRSQGTHGQAKTVLQSGLRKGFLWNYPYDALADMRDVARKGGYTEIEEEITRHINTLKQWSQNDRAMALKR